MRSTRTTLGASAGLAGARAIARWMTTAVVGLATTAAGRVRARLAGGSGSPAVWQRGMATAEYAIVTVAAVGFAGLLVAILRGGVVRELLLGIVRSVLST